LKILLRPRFYSQDFARRIAAEPDLAKALGPQANGPSMLLLKKFFDAASPVLPRVLAHGRGERLSFLWHMAFAPAELAAASHLAVQCRKTIGQTDADRKATWAAYDAETLQPSAGGWSVRLPQRIFLGKAPPPAAICHVDQWTGEYVLGPAAADALRGSGLTGWDLRPVLHHRTKAPQPFAWQLATRDLLPPVLPGVNRFATRDNGPAAQATPRRHGLLVYPRGALAASPDFARTCEPWCENETPQWVVRQAVRAWYAQAALQGWDFWPVLEEGSDPCREHEARFGMLNESLAAAGAELAS
jgi:hypothetical protein